MQRILALAAAFSLCLVGLVAADPALDKEVATILEEINSMNTFSEIYTGTVQIATYEPGKAPMVSAFKLFAKGMKESLLINTLPAKDAGKKILFSGEKIWFYFPDLKRTIVMNPMNTLYGSVSMGDVASSPVLQLYAFESASRVTHEGAEAVAVSFVARDRRAPYGKLIYHYASKRTVYSESYARSGILLKKSWFSDFVTNAAGHLYPTKIKISNAVNPEYYSLIKIGELKSVPSLPAYYFLPDGLEKVDA